jgi:hypothetical protein
MMSRTLGASSFGPSVTFFCADLCRIVFVSSPFAGVVLVFKPSLIPARLTKKRFAKPLSFSYNVSPSQPRDLASWARRFDFVIEIRHYRLPKKGEL